MVIFDSNVSLPEGKYWPDLFWPKQRGDSGRGASEELSPRLAPRRNITIHQWSRGYVHQLPQQNLGEEIHRYTRITEILGQMEDGKTYPQTNHETQRNVCRQYRSSNHEIYEMEVSIWTVGHLQYSWSLAKYPQTQEEGYGKKHIRASGVRKRININQALLIQGWNYRFIITYCIQYIYKSLYIHYSTLLSIKNLQKHI